MALISNNKRGFLAGLRERSQSVWYKSLAVVLLQELSGLRTVERCLASEAVVSRADRVANGRE